MAERRIILAAIAGAHGIGGEVRLKLFSDDLASLKRFKTFEAAGHVLTLQAVRMGSNGPIARFAGIADRTAAEALRGAELSVPRSALPALEDGEYYHADLIGLSCETPTGDPLGEVVAVENFGAGDVLEIERADGARFMVPIQAAKIGEIAVIDPDFMP